MRIASSGLSQTKPWHSNCLNEKYINPLKLPTRFYWPYCAFFADGKIEQGSDWERVAEKNRW